MRSLKKGFRKTKIALLVLGVAALAAMYLNRRDPPPSNPRDLCSIFSEKRLWFHSARRSFARWGVPEAVQLAVLYQESGFRSAARPPRRKILWIFPGPRLSSAYGFAQALDGTWAEYQQSTGRPQAKRYQFDAVADFVGWYGHEIHRLTGIAKDDARNLYLAYHEGPAGYNQGTHRAKGWLLEVASQVASRAERYERQYAGCRARLERRDAWRPLVAALLAAVTGWILWRSRRRRGRRRRR